MFEVHVTVEPFSNDEDIEYADNIAKSFGFRRAKLLMQKRPEDTPERSKFDTFFTGHYDSAEIAHNMMGNFISRMREANFKVWRGKIEHIIHDEHFT